MRNKNVLISGQAPDLSSFYRQQLYNNERNGVTTIVFDYKNNVNYPALEITLADFMPYLTAQECADIYFELAQKHCSNQALLIHQFVLSFNEFSQQTGVPFEKTSFDMLSLHRMSSDLEDSSLYRFLEDNYDHLGILATALCYIADIIGKPRIDLQYSFNQGRVIKIKNNSISGNIYKSGVITNILNCLLEFSDAAHTEFYINGISEEFGKELLEFFLRCNVAKSIVVDDIFVFDHEIRSQLFAGIDKLVFFKHNTNEANKGIAEHIDKEKRYQIGFTHYPTNGIGRIRCLFGNLGEFTNSISTVGIDRDNTGFNASLVDEYRIRTDQIKELSPNQYILVNTFNNSFEIRSL